jgi:hypothetical protein
MKRWTWIVAAVWAFGLILGGSALYAQSTFKIPFKFEAGGKKFPAGEYAVAPQGEGQLALKAATSGAEVLIPFTQRLDPPLPAAVEPRLVFDLVGNFEPSYTEYMTDYVLAEFWVPGQSGFLIHAFKGAHQSQTVKGELAKK